MTTSEFVAHTDLTLLGNIDLSHLQDARGQFVANGDGELLALHLGIEQLVLLHIVDDQTSDEFVLVIIIGPLVGLHVTIFQVLQVGHRELGTLRDNLSTCVVTNTL